MSHLRGKSYVPTLAIRASEMNALEFLPGMSKDSMLPLVLLAPWSTSRRLDAAIARFQRAYPGRPFLLDVDRDYIPSNPDGSAAQAEWLALRSPVERFAHWRAFWQRIPEAIPCLQLEGQTQRAIIQQIRDVQLAGREFCLRIELHRGMMGVSEALSALTEVGTADYSVVIEGGWVGDPLTLMPRINGIINGPLSALDGRVPFVVSCTSMLKGFTTIVGVKQFEFTNRLLMGQLAERTNRAQLIYGDWGSTRPRDDSGGRTPPPRIDYPTIDSWLIARDKDHDWDYQRAAAEITGHDGWSGTLGVWGEELIQATADGDEFAIDTPQKNVAARVNIHLHRQALFGREIEGISLDEPWVD